MVEDAFIEFDEWDAVVLAVGDEGTSADGDTGEELRFAEEF